MTAPPTRPPARPSAPPTDEPAARRTPRPPRTPSIPRTGKTPGRLHTRGTRRTRRTRWVAALGALAVALAALVAVLVVGLRDPGAQARLERAAASQARISLEQVLSYHYRTIDAQSAQVGGLLTGSFKGEFAAAMDSEITPLAVKNQTVVQAKVSDLGVMSSTATSVKVLAFVNQARVGADQKEPVVDQNRVIATMTKVGDRWLVSRLDAF